MARKNGDKTMADEKARTPEQLAREAEVTKLQATADEKNKALGKDKGLRHFVGQTRGKNPKVIEWEAFDKTEPASLPTDTDEFMNITGVKDVPSLVSFLIDGYNDAAYNAASDVLSEYVEPNWSPEMVRKFKAAVSNYASGAGVELEEAVEIMKPGFVKAFQKQLAAA